MCEYPYESPQDCPTDCGYAGYCGDGVCQRNLGERRNNCPEDCAGQCGDGSCGMDENYDSCPIDCGLALCGDGVCQRDQGESRGSCPEDCARNRCGDGMCSYLEDPYSCPEDCYYEEELLTTTGVPTRSRLGQPDSVSPGVINGAESN